MRKKSGYRVGDSLRISKRNCRNEIFTWRPRWLQPTRQTETAYQISCDTGASCVVVPAIALLALSLDVQRERRSRPAQTKVPVLKGLTYEDAERKLHAANLNIRLLATRYDSALQPGLIIDQTPAPGEEVAVGYSVGVTLNKKDFAGPGP
jgi:hypothetical protein